MDRIFSNRWANPVVVLIITISVFIAYSNSFHAAFQFDDMPNIAGNPRLQSLGHLWSILKYNRGITYLTFALNYAIGGPDVFGFHIVNTVIHIINASLVYFLLLSTLGLIGFAAPRARFVAFFTALLFALHPVQTQSVTYIIQRMESLSATFFLLALILFVRGGRAASPAGRWLCYGLTGFCYLLSFYSKETAITLPAVVLLYDFCFLSRGRVAAIFKKRWPLYAVFCFLFAFFVVRTIMPMGGFGDLSSESVAPAEVEPPPSVGTRDFSKLKVSEITAMSAGFHMKGISPKEYLYTEFNVMAYYLALLAVPINQNLDYDFPVSKSLFESPRVNPGTALTIPLPPPVVSLAFLLCVAGAGLWFLATGLGRGSGVRTLAAFCIFWYFIILSPTSSVVPIADVIYEHRLYLPSVAFFTVFVVCVEAASARLFGGRTVGQARPAPAGE